MEWAAAQAIAAVLAVNVTVLGGGFAFLWARLTNTREKVFEVDKKADLNAVEITYLRRDVDGHLQHAPHVQDLSLIHIPSPRDS